MCKKGWTDARLAHYCPNAKESKLAHILPILQRSSSPTNRVKEKSKTPHLGIACWNR